MNESSDHAFTKICYTRSLSHKKTDASQAGKQPGFLGFVLHRKQAVEIDFFLLLLLLHDPNLFSYAV